MNKPVLVILAAGMGSRYGGLKQMEKFGGYGETLPDYSVFDAMRAGFGKTVFIIRRDMKDDFRKAVLSRMEGKTKYELAFQEPDKFVPPNACALARKNGRTKPWGTVHALLCAADKIDAPFAVINADDFYGLEAFKVMGGFLSNPEISCGAIVPYTLESTLSAVGTVARGVCRMKDGYIASMEELKSIEKKDGVIFNTDPDGTVRKLEPDMPVSTNFLGYPTGILPKFRQYFDDFIADYDGGLKSECYISKATDWFIKNGHIKMLSLAADSQWFGVTYKEDRELVVKRLAQLAAQGVYPAPLW